MNDIPRPNAMLSGFPLFFDEEDLHYFIDQSWFVKKADNGIGFYLLGTGKGSRGKLMHRLIMNAPTGQSVDHINRNGLDNRKSNLRFCTYKQNCYNRPKRKNTSSIYKGVSFEKRVGMWSSEYKKDNKTVHLGRFRNEIDAAKAYDIAVEKAFGEFSCTNRKLGLL